MEQERKILGLEGESHERYLPAVNPDVFETPNGISYLRDPGVAVISIPQVVLDGIQGFLDGFPGELDFNRYLQDPTVLPPAETLCKTAGQLCYLSFGPGRTLNANAGNYFKGILESGHGFVSPFCGLNEKSPL